MDEITIGKEEFKALSSDTRISIIKFLNERNYTLSELSAKLNMSSPTIKQHLETLVNSDLIQQKDEGRKWKYYCLTRKGKKLIKPENPPQVMILLATSSIALIALAYILFAPIMQFPIAATEQGANQFNEKDFLSAGAEYTAGEETIRTDSKTDKMVTEEPVNFLQEKTGIIIGLIIVSLITGFLASKAREKKTAI